MASKRPPKRLQDLVERAEEKGWEYDETEDGHPRLTPPVGIVDPYRGNRPAAPVTFGKTPSDHRSDSNAIAILRRLGVDIPHKGRTKKKEQR
jgi:hypothetical protein